MATPTLVASYKAVSTTTTATVASIPNVLVGDWLVIVNAIDFVASTVLVTPTGSGTGTYTQIGAASGGARMVMRAWYKDCTSAGTHSVSCAQSTTNSGNLVVVLHVRGAIGLDGTPTAANLDSAAASQILPALTTTTPDPLLVGCWANIEFGAGNSTHTAPATMAQAQQQLAGDFSDLMVATQALTGPTGSTGTRTATCTPTTTDGGWAGKMFAIMGSQADPIDPGGDLGTGTETVVVDKTDILSTVTDSGTGTEAADVLVDWPPLTDSGTGDDVVVVDIVVDAGILTDSGTGTETVAVANFLAFDLTDSGAGTDVLGVLQTNFVDLTDSGAGTDVLGLEKQFLLTESGTGVEVMVGLGTPSVTDSGVGTEDIYIVDIPFTQVLPPSRLGNLYDLVVVARVPQQTDDPLFIEIDPIEWTDLSFTNQLDVEQELSATCQISTLTPNIIERLRDLATNPTELWLYRNGRLVFAGPIRGGNTSGESLTITAKGILDYVRHMIITSDQTFKNVDQHTIVKKLVDHWQALDYGNYGIDTSMITPSGVTTSATYLKTELHPIYQRINDLSKASNGFNYEIDPITRQLQLWSPTKGIDRSSGEDAVVFDSRNVTSSSVMFSASSTDIATDGFGTGTASSGDGTNYGTAANAELRAKYGRAGISGTWDQVPNQATLNALIQGMVNARNQQLVVPGPDAKDTPDADVTSYGVGDIVLYQPNELLTVTAAFRIRKIAVKVTGSGQESVSLEFV